MSPLLFLTATNELPAAGSTNVPVNAKLNLGFAETISPTAAAQVTIRRTLDDSVFATLSVGGGEIQITDSTVVLASARSLEPQTRYYVVIEPGSFVNAQGAAFPGITVAGAWSFTSGKAPPLLAARWTASGFVIQWPTNAGAFGLEWTTNLAAPAGWLAVTSAPTVISGSNTVWDTAAQAQRFYRLRSNP